MKKFFETSNATALLAGIQFERYAIVGGSVFGVYATDNQDEIAALESLIGARKGALSLITQGDYELCLKKKPRELKNLSDSNAPTPRGESIKQPTAVVVEHSPIPEIPATVVGAVEDPLVVAQVDPEVIAPVVVETPKRRGRQ